MNLIKFSFFDRNDEYDLRFSHEICWSRVYEYPFVLNEIKNTGFKNPKVHNCSWGFRDIHLVFKTWLDIHYDTLHSDIRTSTFYNTRHWDITQPSEFKEHFDIVINISTIEEIPKGDHIQIIKNHLDQVKPEGFLIFTFDYPGLKLAEVETFVNQKIIIPKERLNPKNSILQDKKLNLPEEFYVGYMVIQK
jgi:hypothetical protein